MKAISHVKQKLYITYKQISTHAPYVHLQIGIFNSLYSYMHCMKILFLYYSGRN